MSELALSIALVTALCVANFTVCVFVVRKGSCTRGQAVAQCLMVWFVPLVGAILVGVFLSTSGGSWRRLDGARRDANAEATAGEAFSDVHPRH
jgi:formate/nitrite transporter FocA (FNT family)